MDAVAEKIIARDKKIENAVNNVAEYMKTNLVRSMLYTI
jgi:nucleoid DNA-binding protein